MHGSVIHMNDFRQKEPQLLVAVAAVQKVMSLPTPVPEYVGNFAYFFTTSRQE